MHLNGTLIASALLFISVLSPISPAQESRPGGAAPAIAGSVALKTNQPDAPAGFEIARPGIARGKIIPIEYEARSGGIFRATAHLPPGHVSGKKYPVLYLLHGAMGDEHDWVREMHADAILDNLYAEDKLAPMLVIMPSSLSVAARTEAGDSREAKIRAGMAFGQVLMNDLIPYVESTYPVLPDREHRALAGVSMGGAAALATGLAHYGEFAWIGAFSGAGRRWSVPQEELRLLWLSVGDEDIQAGSGMTAAAAFFKENNVPHEFHIHNGGHEPKVWMNGLYHFAPRLFQTRR